MIEKKIKKEFLESLKIKKFERAKDAIIYLNSIGVTDYAIDKCIIGNACCWSAKIKKTDSEITPRNAQGLLNNFGILITSVDFYFFRKDEALLSMYKVDYDLFLEMYEKEKRECENHKAFFHSILIGFRRNKRKRKIDV